MKWVCKVCGYVYEGDELPEDYVCPLCGVGPEEFEKVDENTYIISGSMPIYDVNKLLNSKIPEGDYDTISGYLQEKMGRIPEDEENPIIETKEVTFKIEEYEDRRIIKIKACRNNTQEQTEE